MTFSSVTKFFEKCFDAFTFNFADNQQHIFSN